MKFFCPILLFGFLFFQNIVFGQKMDFRKDVKSIENLLLEDKLPKADSLLQLTIEINKTNGSYDELSQLVYWQGKIELSANKNSSFPKAIALANFIDDQTKNAFPNYVSYLDLSRLYNESGDLAKALEIGERALQFALKTNSNEALANCHYYLGEYNLRSGKINPFFEYIKKGHQILLKNPQKPFKISARILNYMGAIKYFTSEPDSASYFYNQALKKVDEMEDNLENRLYFPAAINANMVLLKQSQNKFEEALALAEECILLNKEFLTKSKKHPLRFRSERNLSLAYRNLCSLYEQIGDYNRSHQIALIAYEHGKKTFEPQLLEHFSAISLLAETKTSIGDFDNALTILKEAKNSLDSIPGKKPLLQANYHTILGSAYYGKKDFEKAKSAYEKANKYHLGAKEDIYSSDRLFAIINLALSYAQLGQPKAAYHLLNNAYEHQTTNGEAGRLIDALLMAKARAADILDDHKEVVNTTQKFLQKNSDTLLNSASYAFKAEAIALNAKSKLNLSRNPDIDFLKILDSTINEAITILENRKAIITSKENIESLLAENEEVFDMAKKINLNLYQQSKDEPYLEKVIGLHESSIYHRIRSRLNLDTSLGVFKLPDAISKRENNLKKTLQKSAQDFDSFYESNKNWNLFLDSLKTSHPEYYQMRYATLLFPLEKLQENIPDATTILRYFYIDKELYAFVATKENQHFVQLDPIDQSDVESLTNFDSTEKIFQASNSLYKILWEPIVPYLNTKAIVIFPDKSLFNLSFELLTQNLLDNFEELQSQSLLAKYSISYNYSLALLNKNQRILDYENEFVAFAPSFNSRMKDNYVLAISDSIRLDRTYMTLLPQPFSTELAQKFGKRFRGTIFINQNASKQLFTQNAKEHKIIHIGTHAESNNVNPELSRLVFAKNVEDTTNINDNYLYTYEIYNQNLNSNLAILTACETGKPTYQPGEGMISLAHAFNYAGSESILTSLWQIDEQSSTQILEYFYAYLEKGKRKDEALKLAKLDYLKTAKGRTLHPQYWAGLILMGDTAPIELSTSKNWWYWLFGALLIGLFALFLKKSKNRS